MASGCNLVLVDWSDEPLIRTDLARIATRVSDVDRGIRAVVVRDRVCDQLKLMSMWLQPTLSVSMAYLGRRKLLPGRFLSGLLLYKPGEYRRMDQAGIPVPKWTIIAPDTQLDPAIWGPYVVEKPATGRIGAFVRVRRTTRVRYAPPESLPADHYGRQGAMLAQRFIYTGPWPTSYRVVTLFGQVLLCYRQVTKRGHPLIGRWEFKTGGISIVSNTKDMTIELMQDAEVIALAERAHREAFTDFPLLAFDIVRDAETGELFVLECHSGKGIWMFSLPRGIGIQAANKVNFESQFGATDKAAKILATQVRQSAASYVPFRRAATPDA